jgi:DNA-binding transcriptional ArsR family regulator
MNPVDVNARRPADHSNGELMAKKNTRRTAAGERSRPAGPRARVTARSEESPESSSPTGHRWTFLTNHSHVLIVLHSEPDLVLREVALRVGITERAVQKIIQDLEQGGFIVRERVGRRNRYRILVDEPLRHPIESHRSIGDLLLLVSRDAGNGR